ncbi:MAG: DegT/DnrJ/EryC1/StrS family aminotransferase [Gulosibacter sp.]|uniref:DegT/DnrJ/EryC1/StrS family aminotransferase n=1 Tax=Gulosibacter sp. TaxID=2817531 RepID=UPI003F93C8E7
MTLNAVPRHSTAQQRSFAPAGHNTAGSAHSPVYLSAPDTGVLEEQAVIRAMRSGWVAPAGPELDAFEQEMADRVGVSYAVALSSGTAALHLGLLCLGVEPGDVVLTSTLTFAATANAIVYSGAEPYFIDVLPETGNLDPELLEQALAALSDQGERVAAIVPVDLLGKAADYHEIERIAERYRVPVLADAAESLGATHRGRPAGSFGQAAILSFNGNKIMTTSGGGMLLTNDEDLAQSVRYLSTQARQPSLHYEHHDIGFNYRLSNVLAALGRAQLLRLDEILAKRREIRERYRALVATIPGISIFGGDADSEDNCWLTSLVIDETKTTGGWNASELSDALNAQSIECRPLWKPMHLQPVFEGHRGVITGVAEQLFWRGLTVPSGSSMTSEQFGRVISTITDFLAVRS